MSAPAIRPTLVSRLPAVGSPALRNVLLAIAGSIALRASARIQVPVYPVPLTLQEGSAAQIG